MIDENNQNLGMMSKEAALKLAQEKKLDLIEIAPNAEPPVARIISFDKFRYQREKKLKKQKGGRVSQILKRIQIGLKTALHDLKIKANKINEFLKENKKIEIILILRGREKANKDWAKQKLNEFLKIINPEHQIIMEPKFSTRGLTIQIIKKS